MLRWRFENLEQLKKAYDPKIVTRAHRSTVTKTTRKLRTFVSSRVRRRYTVTARLIAKTVKLRSFFKGSPTPKAVLNYVGTRIPLINFSAKPRIIRTRAGKRSGVSVRVLKEEGRKVVKSKPAFIAAGANGNRHVFARTGSGRYPIVVLRGPSVAEMVDHQDIRADSNEFVGQEFPRIFNNEMEYFLLRQVGLR